MNMLAAAELNMYSQKVQTRNRANTIQVWSWKLVFRIALTVVRFLGKALQKLVVKNDLSIKSNSRYVRYWNQTLMAEAGGCELAKIQSRVVHLKATLLCGTTLKLGTTSRLAWFKLSKLVRYRMLAICLRVRFSKIRLVCCDKSFSLVVKIDLFQLAFFYA